MLLKPNCYVIKWFLLVSKNEDTAKKKKKDEDEDETDLDEMLKNMGPSNEVFFQSQIVDIYVS